MSLLSVTLNMNISTLQLLYKVVEYKSIYCSFPLKYGKCAFNYSLHLQSIKILNRFIYFQCSDDGGWFVNIFKGFFRRLHIYEVEYTEYN